VFIYNFSELFFCFFSFSMFLFNLFFSCIFFCFFKLLLLHVNLYVEHYSTTFQIGCIYIYFFLIFFVILHFVISFDFSNFVVYFFFSPTCSTK